MQEKDQSITLPWTLILAGLLVLAGCGQSQDSSTSAADSAASDQTSMVATTELTDAQVENIVRRSYQFVAMYNVNNKFVMDPSNPLSIGGWNRVKANTTLADHTLKAIARPNNDTLYIGAALDLREEPVILEAPAFESNAGASKMTGSSRRSSAAPLYSVSLLGRAMALSV